MGDFLWENNKFVYADQHGKKILLDCGDLLSNKSRIPMHRIPGEAPQQILPELIVASMNKIRQEDGTKVFSAALIATLLADRLIRSSQPIHVLEYGCMQGILSSQLAELIGAFNEDSIFVCAYDTMELEWMERISRIEKLPKLSYIAGDFGHLQLRRDYFDIVVINGSVHYTEPLEVLKNVLDLVTEDGTILCYMDHSPLLESTFKLFFEKREEYEISPQEKILLAKAEDRCWEIKGKKDFIAYVQHHLDMAEKMLLCKEKDQTKIAKSIENLRKDAENAAQQGLVTLKKRILEQKEQLIIYRLKMNVHEKE